MRSRSLVAIRQRVDRLAEACGADGAETIVVHWTNPYDTCPSCGYDLDAHARGEALSKAMEAPENRRPMFVCYWVGWLTTCPHCGRDFEN